MKSDDTNPEVLRTDRFVSQTKPIFSFEYPVFKRWSDLHSKDGKNRHTILGLQPTQPLSSVGAQIQIEWHQAGYSTEQKARQNPHGVLYLKILHNGIDAAEFQTPGGFVHLELNFNQLPGFDKDLFWKSVLETFEIHSDKPETKEQTVRYEIDGNPAAKLDFQKMLENLTEISGSRMSAKGETENGTPGFVIRFEAHDRDGRVWGVQELVATDGTINSISPRRPAMPNVAADFAGRMQQATPVANEPKLGVPLPKGIGPSSYKLLTSPSQMSPAYTVDFMGTKYIICSDQKQRIRYISTSDPAFRTPEGLAIGNPLGKVLQISHVSAHKLPGWGYVVPLKSGWNAGFFIGESGTDREPQPNEPVGWFFKN